MAVLLHSGGSEWNPVGKAAIFQVKGQRKGKRNQKSVNYGQKGADLMVYSLIQRIQADSVIEQDYLLERKSQYLFKDQYHGVCFEELPWLQRRMSNVAQKWDIGRA